MAKARARDLVNGIDKGTAGDTGHDENEIPMKENAQRTPGHEDMVHVDGHGREGRAKRSKRR